MGQNLSHGYRGAIGNRFWSSLSILIPAPAVIMDRAEASIADFRTYWNACALFPELDLKVGDSLAVLMVKNRALSLVWLTEFRSFGTLVLQI